MKKLEPVHCLTLLSLSHSALDLLALLARIKVLQFPVLQALGNAHQTSNSVSGVFIFSRLYVTSKQKINQCDQLPLQLSM